MAHQSWTNPITCSSGTTYTKMLSASFLWHLWPNVFGQGSGRTLCFYNFVSLFTPFLLTHNVLFLPLHLSKANRLLRSRTVKWNNSLFCPRKPWEPNRHLVEQWSEKVMDLDPSPSSVHQWSWVSNIISRCWSSIFLNCKMGEQHLFLKVAAYDVKKDTKWSFCHMPGAALAFLPSHLYLVIFIFYF